MGQNWKYVPVVAGRLESGRPRALGEPRRRAQLVERTRFAAAHRVARERLHVAAQVRLADGREARRCAGRARATGARRGVLSRRAQRRGPGRRATAAITTACAADVRIGIDIRRLGITGSWRRRS